MDSVDRYDGRPLGNASKNVVLISSEVSEAGLLSQGRVKAILSDGGWDSCVAAICQGVPLLGLPLNSLQVPPTYIKHFFD